MPTSYSRASYPDCEKFLDAALGDDQGARLPCATPGAAKQMVVRLNTFRTICRADNAKIFQALDHPLHGRSEYDPLEIVVRGPDAAGEYWVYAFRRDYNIESSIEKLSELDSGGFVEGYEV
jgi:hypothetical protein